MILMNSEIKTAALAAACASVTMRTASGPCTPTSGAGDVVFSPGPSPEVQPFRSRSSWHASRPDRRSQSPRADGYGSATFVLGREAPATDDIPEPLLTHGLRPKSYFRPTRSCAVSRYAKSEPRHAFYGRWLCAWQSGSAKKRTTGGSRRACACSTSQKPPAPGSAAQAFTSSSKATGGGVRLTGSSPRTRNCWISRRRSCGTPPSTDRSKP